MDTTPLLWVALVTGLGALVVMVWQTVRYFRENRGDDRDDRDGDGPAV